MTPGQVRLRLDYHPPLAWPALLAFLGARAIPGVEEVAGDAYRRTVRLGDRRGWIEVAPHPRRDALLARVSTSLAGALSPLETRLRHLFDLDARPDEIEAHLGRDAALRGLIRRRPGLRVPGAVDGFEAAVRAVLGQQITVKGATTLAGRLAERLGTAQATPFPALTRLFPSAPRLAATPAGEVAALGLPGARARALVGLARAVASGLRLHPGAPLEPTLARLGELAGFGPWTTQYVAMRALGFADAFPAADLGVLTALRLERPAQALARAEPWRPFRAYATLHLWAGSAFFVTSPPAR